MSKQVENAWPRWRVRGFIAREANHIGVDYVQGFGVAMPEPVPN